MTARKDVLVALPTLLRLLNARLAVRAVIDKSANGNPGEELRDTAGMVYVIVSEQDEINSSRGQLSWRR